MMARQDADLAAVREAVAARTRDDELSLARSWGTVVARQAGVEQPPRRRATRVLVPVTAAALVAAVTLGTVALLGPQWDGLGFLAADPGSPSDTESYHPNLDPPSEAAVAALRALAEAAEQGEPATIEDGQLVYVRSEGWATAYVVGQDGPAIGQIVWQDWEGWYAPDGMVPLRIDRDIDALPGDGTGTPLPAEPDGDPSARPGADPTATPEPGPYAPTPAWLAGLPTDPERLRAELRRLLKDDHTWSTDHAIWTAMTELYATSETLIPPVVRAALLRAFTGLHGLTLVEVDIDGRQLIGIRHAERESGDDILFDPQTGQAVGRRSVSLGEAPKVVRLPGGPSVDQSTLDAGITHQSLWTQAVVDAVGDTG